MNFLELIRTAFTSLGSNLSRTALTMLGIIIGITSVISMLAVGNGSQQSIQNSVSALGSNLLTVTSSAQRTGLVGGAGGSGNTLTQGDVTAIRTDPSMTSVAAVSPEYSQNEQVVTSTSNENVTVTGVEPDYATVHDYQADIGNFITQDNVDSQNKVAVLGPDTATTLFGTTDVIGQTIRINKLIFNVVGVTKAKGSNGVQNSDDAVFIPLSTAQKIIFGQSNLRTIVVQVADSTQMDVVQTELDNLLRVRHKIAATGTEDFTIRNSTTTLSTLTSVTSVFTTLLASISGISLLVGGIGIMNIMIVTVTERTKEIGLRKAIGAKNDSILSQFLVESVILTFSGGVIGVLLGYLVSYVLTVTKIQTADVSLNSVFLSVGISVLIGVAFGIYPAYKAAQLSPIEALKYE
jgi:putative ABC transport system permease protein